MPKGARGYEAQKDGGFIAPKYDAAGKPLTKHGGRGVMQDGKVSTGTKYPYGKAKGDGRTE